MESPFWLPPLNSHDRYSTTVTVSQSEHPIIDRECPEKTFLIDVEIDVNFYSSNSKETIPLKGLSVRDKFEAPIDFMICSSPGEVKKYISGILWFMHVPFELHHVGFIANHLKGTSKRKRQDYSAENADSWIVKLQKFLLAMNQDIYNAGHNVLPLNLSIKRNVWISSDEFKTWSSWFNDKQRVDPSFQTNYRQAVSRPRTIQELLEAENLKCKRTKKSSLAALKEASLNDESNSQCMVCLEELSPGHEVCQLPCSHIFHKSCIHKWLQESNVCPLCRSSLASD